MRSVRHLGVLIFISILAVLLSGQTAQAQEATPAQRAEVRKLVRERDQLQQRLTTLDRRAADAIKNGEDPVTLHAEIINVQDELDLTQLRLEILATQYALPIPAVPGERDIRGGGAEKSAEELDRRIQQSLSRGRERAMDLIRADYKRFVRSLDFSSFLDFE